MPRPRSYTPEQERTVLDMRSDGVTYGRIAQKTGIALSTVKHIIFSKSPASKVASERRRAAAEKRGREFLEKVTALREKGYGWHKIGRELNCSWNKAHLAYTSQDRQCTPLSTECWRCQGTRHLLIFQGKTICDRCLNKDQEPLRLEDHLAGKSQMEQMAETMPDAPHRAIGFLRRLNAEMEKRGIPTKAAWATGGQR